MGINYQRVHNKDNESSIVLSFTKGSPGCKLVNEKESEEEILMKFTDLIPPSISFSLPLSVAPDLTVDVNIAPEE